MAPLTSDGYSFCYLVFACELFNPCLWVGTSGKPVYLPDLQKSRKVPPEKHR